MTLTTLMKTQLNNSNRAMQNAQVGTLLGNLESGYINGSSSGASINAGVTSGTIKNQVKTLTGASATTIGIDYHKLFTIGDETGNTAYGMGDPAKPTTGLMASFGRTALATGTMTDTAADFRIINKLVDTTGVHSMQGLYVKAKNYSGATLTGNLYGAFIETVADGTVSGASAMLKLGTDGTRVNKMIDGSNMLLTRYTSNKVVVLAEFVDAAGTPQYLIHNTDAATAVSVTSSAPS